MPGVARGVFNSKSSLIVDNGEIFFVGAIGAIEDLEINKIDLGKLYTEIEYNGTHPEGLGYSSRESLLSTLKKSIETGDF